MRIRKPEELLLHSSRGAVFESYVIAELYKRALHYGKEADLYFWRDSAGHEVDVILDNICALSNFQDIYFLWRPYLKDPKDDHVLEVAVASKTKTILTHNIKDFKGVEKFGIKAITPGKYLEEIK